VLTRHTFRLVGLIEMADVYLGGERAGGKHGRGSSGKTPIIVAAEITAQGQRELRDGEAAK
jgi:hypothetical protein